MVFSKIIKVVFCALFFIILIFFNYLLICKYFYKQNIPLLFGYGTAVVVSNSMAPIIEKNDLILLQRQDTYSVGDIITFEDDNKSLVTHRIVNIENGNYFTKGDNNDLIDNKNINQIYGKVVKVFNGFGGVVEYLKSPILFIICLCCLFIFFIRNTVKH